MQTWNNARRLVRLLPLAVLAACATVNVPPIDPGSLALPAGHRLLFFGVSRHLFGYGVEEPPQQLRLPGGNVVRFSGAASKGGDLEALVGTAIGERRFDMAIGVRPVSRVEERYHPYSAFDGWRRRLVLDGYIKGRPVYREIMEPVYETRYRNLCRRITYEVYQFDASGRWVGMSSLENPDPEACPQTTDSDVVIDEADHAAAWLAARFDGRQP